MLLSPQYLWLFLLLIPVVYIQYRNYRIGRREFGKIKGSGDAERLFDAFTVKWFFSSLFYNFAMIFLILSLVGIRSEQKDVRNLPAGSDVIFCLDISRSMLSDDVNPSRLERALTVIQSITNRYEEARFGLVVFKGTGLVLVPVTEDREALKQFIDVVNPDILSAGGTNLEAGLNTAFAAFPSGEDRRKIVVLISDGEGHEGKATEAASSAQELDIGLKVVAVGTEGGGRIPLGEEEYLRDENGEIVVSRLRAAELQRIADAAQGTFCRLESITSMNEVMSCIEVNSGSGGIQFVERGRYKLFLFAAAMALILSVLVKVVPWHGTY
jgi:Ca-activated chloride channel family protein